MSRLWSPGLADTAISPALSYLLFKDATVKPAIYFSIDIETLGSVAGIHSMISLGCVAFRPEGEILATYTANLRPLTDLQIDPATVEWWKQFPEAFEESTHDARGAEEVLKEFDAWVRQTAGNASATACCWPNWDFGFVHYYLHRFAPVNRSETSCGCVFTHRCLCIRTLVTAALGLPFRGFGKREIPKEWFGGVGHSHNALEDALEQAHLCINALAEVRRIHSRKEMP